VNGEHREPVDVSLYEAVGGGSALVALANAWHQRCLGDPVASHPFSHGGIHPRHTERLAAYWAEALGGPADYTASMGDHTGVVRMHAGNGDHPELDERAIELFDLAMADVGIAERARPVLAAYFRALIRRLAAYPASAGDVPDALPFPHWSWTGAVGEPPE
jgi:hemoglobin